MIKIYRVTLTLMKFIQTATPIQICDIGASPIDKTEFIEILLDKTNSKIIGFEPNKDEFIKLEQSSKKKFFNYAIGDGKVHNLNICREPGMTSILKPNYEYLKFLGVADQVNNPEELNQSLVKEFKEVKTKNNQVIEKIDNYGLNILNNVIKEIKIYIDA